jgi:hypothetical protein
MLPSILTIAGAAVFVIAVSHATITVSVASLAHEVLKAHVHHCAHHHLLTMAPSALQVLHMTTVYYGDHISCIACQKYVI